MTVYINGTTGYTGPISSVGSISSSGNLTFTGTGAIISGDFSNATLLSRTMFQTTTANSSTGIYALPSGTSTAASWQATNAADPTNASKILIATNGSTDVQLVSGRNGSGTYLPLTFYTNGSEQMRLDTSGNLGLGVTPSAWGGTASFKALQIGPTSSSMFLFGGDLLASLGYNAYYNGTSYKYANATSSYAVRYVMSTGSHIWYNAAAGTAGNDITWTQAMTLDASGNLGVGVTSPARRIHVNPATDTYAIRVQRGNNDSQFGLIGQVGGALTLLSDGYSGNGQILFKGAANGGAETEYARITAAGNLLVGTSTLTGGRLIVADSAKAGNDTALILSSTDASNQMQLVFVRQGSSYYKIQAVEQGVAYRDIAFNTDGGSVGINTTTPSSSTVAGTVAKLVVNGRVFINSYTQTYLLEQGSGMGDSGGSTTWVYIGRYDAGQSGYMVNIRYFFHVGFNANPDQIGSVDIIFSTSNGGSSQSGSSGAFYGAGNAYWLGPNSNVGYGGVRVIQINTSTYDIYCAQGNYSNGSYITVSTTPGTYFTPNGSHSTSAPSGNYITLPNKTITYT